MFELFLCLSPPRSSHFLYSNENLSPGVLSAVKLPYHSPWLLLLLICVVSGRLSPPHAPPLAVYSLLFTSSASFLQISVWPALVHLGAPNLLCIPLFVQYLQRCFLSWYFLESNRLPEDKYFSVEFWKAVVKNFSVGKRINTPSD